MSDVKMLCYLCETGVKHVCLDNLRADIDIAHRRLDSVLVHINHNHKAVTQDICKLLDEFRAHQKQPHQQPLYGRIWVKENPSRQALEQKLHEYKNKLAEYEAQNKNLTELNRELQERNENQKFMIELSKDNDMQRRKENNEHIKALEKEMNLERDAKENFRKHYESIFENNKHLNYSIDTLRNEVTKLRAELKEAKFMRVGNVDTIKHLQERLKYCSCKMLGSHGGCCL
jgi:chromosome segregation ATPase